MRINRGGGENYMKMGKTIMGFFCLKLKSRSPEVWSSDRDRGRVVNKTRSGECECVREKWDERETPLIIGDRKQHTVRKTQNPRLPTTMGPVQLGVSVTNKMDSFFLSFNTAIFREYYLLITLISLRF